MNIKYTFKEESKEITENEFVLSKALADIAFACILSGTSERDIILTFLHSATGILTVGDDSDSAKKEIPELIEEAFERSNAIIKMG